MYVTLCDANVIVIDDPIHPFYDYFMRNWHLCRDMWASFEREDVPHLGNNTNNRLESAWGKLKNRLSGTLSLDVAIDRLLDCAKISMQNFDARSNEALTPVCNQYDEHMSKFLAMTSFHAAELVFRQYEWATQVCFVFACYTHVLIKCL
jgi:hypothetical protein